MKKKIKVKDIHGIPVASGSKLSEEGYVTVAFVDYSSIENTNIDFSEVQLYDEAPVAKATGLSIYTEGVLNKASEKK